ncbi:hypothetical protein BGX34_000781 [Mortierella sp. NVP85]|nr:hypothetical protein BGX34_000781 [Mortierella sp. NVP85]
MHGTNPLEIPELIRRISRYVTKNDATACARVCKAWSEHFVSAIWHTIDFDVNINFHQMNTKVLARHGHHIRIVKNMTEHDHIWLLTIANANKLKELAVRMMPSQEFYALFSDLLRRVNTSLKHIDIFQPYMDAVPYFAVDSLFPTTSTGRSSKLSDITIGGLVMTRDALSSLLEHCPLLNKLDIRDTTLLCWPTYDSSTAHYFQHTGVKEFTAPVEQIFMMDQNYRNTPSLFVHFPNLELWVAWNSDEHVDISIKVIRDEIARHCPSLKELCLETRPSVGIGMLTQALKNLTSIYILNDHLSAEMVMAILNHQETLIEVGTFIAEDRSELEVVPEVESHQLDTSGWIVQSLPRRCTRLKIMDLTSLEMDMDDIEMTDWGCHDLEELSIRVKGLDTKGKIDRAIQLWKEGRITIREKQLMDVQMASSSTNPQLESIILAGDNSIEARVAKHLLKFKKLREVWLGWKVRRVRTQE